MTSQPNDAVHAQTEFSILHCIASDDVLHSLFFYFEEPQCNIHILIWLEILRRTFHMHVKMKNMA